MCTVTEVYDTMSCVTNHEWQSSDRREQVFRVGAAAPRVFLTRNTCSPTPSLFHLNDVFHLCDRKGKQTNLALYTDVSICCALKQKIANDLALTSRFKRHKKRLPKSTLCAPSLVPRPFRSARGGSGDETIVHLSLTCMPDASLPTPCRRAGTIAYTNLCLE